MHARRYLQPVKGPIADADRQPLGPRCALEAFTMVFGIRYRVFIANC